MPVELSSSVRSVKQRCLATSVTLQSAAVATGNGTAVNPPKSFPGTILVRGITTATVKIEMSQDGTNYVQYGSDITADKAVEVFSPTIYLRARISAYTSGTISVFWME